MLNIESSVDFNQWVEAHLIRTAEEYAAVEDLERLLAKADVEAKADLKLSHRYKSKSGFGLSRNWFKAGAAPMKAMSFISPRMV